MIIPREYFVWTGYRGHSFLNDIPAIRRFNPWGTELFGHVVENYVATELRKLLSFGTPADLYHFRTGDNRELDFILEHADGRLAAIEVKTSDHVRAEDFNGIRYFADLVGPSLQSGVVLYRGRDIVPFGENLWAVPIDVLWS